MSYVTETKIGNTTFVITAVCSPNATETLEQKIERILRRHATDAKTSMPEELAISENLREYGLATN